VINPDATFTAAKFGGEPLRDAPLLTWCGELIASLLG
jgi:transcription-repair coupling factor (superfamily II helicase)